MSANMQRFVQAADESGTEKQELQAGEQSLIELLSLRVDILS